MPGRAIRFQYNQPLYEKPGAWPGLSDDELNTPIVSPCHAGCKRHTMEDDQSKKARAKKLVRRIEEETAAAYAKFGEKMLANHNDIQHLNKSVMWYLGQHFDIHAKWYLFVIETYEDVDTAYENVLIEISKETAKGLKKLRSQWPNLEHIMNDDASIVFSYVPACIIPSIKVAATRLAVSVSILNSTMADHGKVRYSADTLANVLKKIAPKDNRKP